LKLPVARKLKTTALRRGEEWKAWWKWWRIEMRVYACGGGAALGRGSERIDDGNKQKQQDNNDNDGKAAVLHKTIRH
jgi:hypothetical protein